MASFCRNAVRGYGRSKNGFVLSIRWSGALPDRALGPSRDETAFHQRPGVSGVAGVCGTPQPRRLGHRFDRKPGVRRTADPCHPETSKTPGSPWDEVEWVRFVLSDVPSVRDRVIRRLRTIPRRRGGSRHGTDWVRFVASRANRFLHPRAPKRVGGRRGEDVSAFSGSVAGHGLNHCSRSKSKSAWLCCLGFPIQNIIFVFEVGYQTISVNRDRFRRSDRSVTIGGGAVSGGWVAVGKGLVGPCAS